MLTAKTSGLGAELSVLIAIKLNGVQTNGLVDSGAGPSVIDIGTVCALGLERLMKRPIHVVGKLDLTVDLGDKQVLEHTFEVLKDTGTMCILVGRDLLKKLGTTEFDWQSRQVRLGTTWKSSQATIEGGEPISRANIAVLEDATDLEQKSPRNIVNPDLPAEQKTALSNLLHTFEHVFAQNPKRPRLAKGVTHCIDTGSAPPCKQRPIPVRLRWHSLIGRRNLFCKQMLIGLCRGNIISAGNIFSSGLTDAQRKYAAGELECWAVILATRKFRKYLRAATHVKIQTDLTDLCGLESKRTLEGNLQEGLRVRVDQLFN